jgi:hypothetical protein
MKEEDFDVRKIYSAPKGVGVVVERRDNGLYAFMTYGGAEPEEVSPEDLREVSHNTLERIKLDPAFTAWAREQLHKQK